MHPSIIDPHVLLQDLLVINYHQLKFPVKLSAENIMVLESLINIKAFRRETNIVFMLEIPLVDKDIYDLYRIYSLPMKNENVTKIIIPSIRYMLYNERYYSNLENNCKEILPYEFLCNTVNLLPINDQSPCEVQIATLSNDYKNCQQIPIILGNIKTQKIENNHWIIISGNQTKLC